MPAGNGYLSDLIVFLHHFEYIGFLILSTTIDACGEVLESIKIDPDHLACGFAIIFDIMKNYSWNLMGLDMGQAKQRGTREERLAQKLGLVERSLDEVKRDLNIPDDAKFLGYGVHLEESDEFLSGFNDQGGMTSKIWVKTPEKAKLFMEFSGAYDMSRKCSGSVVVGIFDTEKQMWVAIAQN